ncbi:MAG TPA: tyrosine-type recombinase/integrase [Clostridia bacterium]|nr:tyrosine-type recombinase/integrase [Clostridia bacterium]HQA97231.1 tyrosine-type recombinase/integrase [Clostridia bacterium]HQO56969.1 tyrosine-type recombinase/integrase [Clostridia bacterium]
MDDDPFESANDSKAYTDKQVIRLMKSISGNLAERDRAIVALLSGSGLRASELCSLTINQWFGRQNGHIYVKRKGGAMRWLAVASYVRCLCRGLPAHQRGTQRG